MITGRTKIKNTNISIRAKNALAEACRLKVIQIGKPYGELTVGDLSNNSVSALSALEGVGGATLKELTVLCKKAGVRLSK